MQAYDLDFATYSRVVRGVRNYINQSKGASSYLSGSWAVPFAPVSKGSSEVMKIFGSPTFQLKASTPQEACSEVLKTVRRYLKCGLRQSRALEQGSRSTERVVMKSQKYWEEAKSARAANL